MLAGGLLVEASGTLEVGVLHEPSVAVHRLGVAGLGGPPEEVVAELLVPHVRVVEIDDREAVEGPRASRPFEPVDRPLQVLLRPLAEHVELSQVGHSAGAPALGRSPVPEEGLRAVLRDAVSIVVHHADVAHGPGAARLGGLDVQPGTFRLVPLDADPDGVAVGEVPHPHDVSGLRRPAEQGHGLPFHVVRPSGEDGAEIHERGRVVPVLP